MPIHPSAYVDPAATVDPTAVIGPHVVIEGPVRIGPNTRIISQAYIAGWTIIGAGCTIHSFASIGDAPQDLSYSGEESYCRVGDRTIIREGVSIHRGSRAASSTTVGKDCLLMAGSHVGHDCTVQDNVVLANLAILAGHVHVGARAFISGGAGVHQFVRIGELAMIGGLSKVVMDVPPFFTVDRDGRCAGVNVVGMRRAGFSKEERAEVQGAFRALFRNGKPFQEAVAALMQQLSTPAGIRLTTFLAAEANRGIASGRERTLRRLVADPIEPATSIS